MQDSKITASGSELNDKEAAKRYRSCRGQILPILAVCALLIVLLAVSLSIDVPVTHTARETAQKAFDAASLHGASNHLDSYDDMLSIAAKHLEHSYQDPAYHYFTNTRTILPVFAVPTLQDFGGARMLYYTNHVSYFIDSLWNYHDDTPKCIFSSAPGYCSNSYTGTFYPEENMPMDGFTLNDFRNGIMSYARFRPEQVFNWAGLLFGPTDRETQIDVASVYRIGTTINYVLFDPAFTMNRDNFISMFAIDDASFHDPTNTDLNGNPSDNRNVWPVRASQDLGQWLEDSVAPWNWPTQLQQSPKWRPSLLQNEPRGINAPALGTPAAALDDVVDPYYRFYAAFCDSAPWANFKEASVRMIDWLSQSSFASYTTAVGIMGFGHPEMPRYWPLIPVFPAVNYDADTGNSVIPTNEGKVSLHPGLNSLYYANQTVGTSTFYPANNSSRPIPDGATLFPLEHSYNWWNPANHRPFSNQSLFMRRQNAFAGYINTNDPHIQANQQDPYAAYDPNNPVNPFYELSAPVCPNPTPPNPEDDIGAVKGSSLNRWELGLCSAYFRREADDANTAFRLIAGSQYDDHDNASSADYEEDRFDYNKRYINANNSQYNPRRVRSDTSGPNWVDDDPTDFYEINLEQHQTARRNPSDATPGDTPRNLIAMQGIRVNNPGLDDIGNPYNELADCVDPALVETPNTIRSTHWAGADEHWHRPRIPGGDYNPPFSPIYDPMSSGWRYHAPAMMAAAQYLDAARRDYATDSYMNQHRPIAATTLIVNGFAPWNFSTLARLTAAGVLPGPSASPDDIQSATDEFQTAVARILCEWKVNLILNYMPMSQYDADLIITIDDEIIGPYQSYFTRLDRGEDPPLSDLPQACRNARGNSPDQGRQVARVYLLVTDYSNTFEANRFDTAVSEVRRKLRASASYAGQTPFAIKSILLKQALSQ